MNGTVGSEESTAPAWRPLRREGTVGVEVRLLLRRPRLALASLRFCSLAHIDEHSAPYEIDVVCLSGEGYVSVGGHERPFRTGESVVWPAGALHRLRTEGSCMETLMIEHHEA